MLKTPAVMVVKKNVKVLERISDWLTIQHNLVYGEKIKYPILLIDDEADNASINTHDEDSDPTKTNAGIRRLLNLFNKYSYVGFTATPFANIFINPDNYDKQYGKDLFPSDFIFSLVPPESYIGAKDIFLDNSKYKKSLIINDDCNSVLPYNHKKYASFDHLPETLKEAIVLFTISNVIRDLKGDVTEHRSMLVNISRFICMHDIIGDTVLAYFNQILNSYFSFSKTFGTDDNSDMKFAKSIFEKEYA